MSDKPFSDRCEFRIGRFSLQWDRDYGFYGSRGWSVVWNGCFVVQLEPWLLVALFKFFRNVRHYDSWREFWGFEL